MEEGRGRRIEEPRSRGAEEPRRRGDAETRRREETRRRGEENGEKKRSERIEADIGLSLSRSLSQGLRQNIPDFCTCGSRDDDHPPRPTEMTVASRPPETFSQTDESRQPLEKKNPKGWVGRSVAGLGRGGGQREPERNGEMLSAKGEGEELLNFFICK
jgi:hypothetical protein